MSFGTFVEVYPDNSQTEEYALSGAQPPVVLSNLFFEPVAVFRSNGAKACILEITAKTTAGGVDGPLELFFYVGYQSDPAGLITNAVAEPITMLVSTNIINSDHPTIVPQNALQYNRSGQSGYSRFVHCPAMEPVLIPIRLLPSDNRTRIVIFAKEQVSDIVTSFKIRVALSDSDIADPVFMDATDTSIAYIQGHEYLMNTPLLAAGGTRTSSVFDLLSSQSITLFSYCAVGSAANGLTLNWSADGTNFDIVDTFDVYAARPFELSMITKARYLKIIYINGGVPQASWRFSLIARPFPMETSNANEAILDLAYTGINLTTVTRSTHGRLEQQTLIYDGSNNLTGVSEFLPI